MIIRFLKDIKIIFPLFKLLYNSVNIFSRAYNLITNLHYLCIAIVFLFSLAFRVLPFMSFVSFIVFSFISCLTTHCIHSHSRHQHCRQRHYRFWYSYRAAGFIKNYFSKDFYSKSNRQGYERKVTNSFFISLLLKQMIFNINDQRIGRWLVAWLAIRNHVYLACCQ